MRPLLERMTQANTLLAPYAVPHGGRLGRVYTEPEDATRFPFQRDRDRIIHTQAFRRLKHKTQVFVSGHGDHYRTRITHTLEVAQVSRNVARTLGLNEDLAEAIALAHDLGHTPFGHAGEDAVAACMKPFGKTFEHNEQSLRIVRLLERRSSLYPGLNLSCEVLEGLIKHRDLADMPAGHVLPRSLSLEAQIVNLADEISYTAHDTDDGLRAELFTSAIVQGTALGKAAAVLATSKASELRSAIVDLLVTDLYAETETRLREHKIRTLADVYVAKQPLVGFSSEMEDMLREHREFLWRHLYKSASVLKQAAHGKNVITKLFSAYLTSPPDKVKALKKETDSSPEEAVKDYIAGMTDTFALELFQKL